MMLQSMAWPSLGVHYLWCLSWTAMRCAGNHTWMSKARLESPEKEFRRGQSQHNMSDRFWSQIMSGTADARDPQSQPAAILCWSIPSLLTGVAHCWRFFFLKAKKMCHWYPLMVVDTGSFHVLLHILSFSDVFSLLLNLRAREDGWRMRMSLKTAAALTQSGMARLLLYVFQCVLLPSTTLKSTVL